MKTIHILTSIVVVTLSLTQLDAIAQRGTTIELPTRKVSSPAEVKSEAEKDAGTVSQSGLPFMSNDSYLTDPASLLGSILVLRKSNPDSTKEHPTFEAFGFRGFNVGPTESKFANSISSLVINQSLKAEVGFLSFFSSELSVSNMLSMMIKNEQVQRVKDDQKWEESYDRWSTNSRNAKLFADPDVTAILVVRGYVLKSFTYKRYTQIDGSAKGSYGVSVDGKGYYGTDENKIVYLWGLDYATLFVGTGTTISSNQVHSPKDATKAEINRINKVLTGANIKRMTSE